MSFLDSLDLDFDLDLLLDLTDINNIILPDAGPDVIQPPDDIKTKIKEIRAGWLPLLFVTISMALNHFYILYLFIST